MHQSFHKEVTNSAAGSYSLGKIFNEIGNFYSLVKFLFSNEIL